MEPSHVLGKPSPAAPVQLPGAFATALLLIRAPLLLGHGSTEERGYCLDCSGSLQSVLGHRLLSPGSAATGAVPGWGSHPGLTLILLRGCVGLGAAPFPFPVPSPCCLPFPCPCFLPFPCLPSCSHCATSHSPGRPFHSPRALGAPSRGAAPCRIPEGSRGQLGCSPRGRAVGRGRVLPLPLVPAAPSPRWRAEECR